MPAWTLSWSWMIWSWSWSLYMRNVLLNLLISRVCHSPHLPHQLKSEKSFDDSKGPLLMGAHQLQIHHIFLTKKAQMIRLKIIRNFPDPFSQCFNLNSTFRKFEGVSLIQKFYDKLFWKWMDYGSNRVHISHQLQINLQLNMWHRSEARDNCIEWGGGMLYTYSKLWPQQSGGLAHIDYTIMTFSIREIASSNLTSLLSYVIL